MITQKKGTVNVSGASDLGSMQIGVGTAGIVNLSLELSNLLQVENAADAPAARDRFDAISVKVPIKERLFDVAVPYETFGAAPGLQWIIAVRTGGHIGTRDQNYEVANYLLGREAFYLLAKEKAGTLTDEETKLLKLHQEEWQKEKEVGEIHWELAIRLAIKRKEGTINPQEKKMLEHAEKRQKQGKSAETRAKEAGEITDNEAALLKVYRDKWVRDSAGGVGVEGVRVRVYKECSPDGCLEEGALVVVALPQKRSDDHKSFITPLTGSPIDA